MKENIPTLILIAGFAVVAALLAGNLAGNFDEGFYILQARSIAQGKLPLIDFFHQQPPLYIYLLGGWTFLGSDSFEFCRFFSILCFSITAFFVADLSARRLGSEYRLLTAALFIFSPLTRFGIFAMPTSLMILFTVAGFWAYFGPRRFTVLAALCFVLSILAKPTAVPSALVIPVILLVRRQWGELLKFGTSGVVFSAAAAVALYAMSSGLFFELVAAQTDRLTDAGVFRKMLQYRLFTDHLQKQGIDTVLQFNLDEHKQTFIRPFLRNLSLVYLLLGLWGQYRLTRLRHPIAPLTLSWLGINFVSLMFLILPSYDHYHIQYLPVLVILAAYAIRSLENQTRQIAAMLIVGLCIIQFSWAIVVTPWSAGYFRGLFKPGESIVAFYPTLHAIANTSDTCDAKDPLNTYGETVMLGYAKSPRWQKFLDTDAHIIGCLKDHPEAKVFMNMYLRGLASDKLLAFVDALPPERIVVDRHSSSLLERWLR